MNSVYEIFHYGTSPEIYNAGTQQERMCATSGTQCTSDFFENLSFKVLFLPQL